MKTIQTTVKKSETSSTLDLSEELKGIPKSQRESVLKDIGELLVERTLSALADQKSPVSGYGRFKALSQAYREKKKDETGSSDANLDLTGAMISALDYKVSGNKLTIGVFGEDAPKADGHNNLSGSSQLPTRRFLPEEGETYTREIEQLIRDELRYKKADIGGEVVLKGIEDVETSADLYELLSKVIGDYSKAKLRDAALSSSLKLILEEYDMLDLL